jgi:predicted RNA methylase
MKIKINRSVEKQLRPILDQIEDHDIWYPLYNERGKPVFAGRNKYEEFYTDLDRYVDFRGKTVVDLGCNLGHYSFLAARLGAARIVGLDINEKMIHACNILRDHLGLSRVEFKLTDFLSTAADNCYDIVIMIDYIGKNVINKFKLKQVLAAAESHSRKEIFFTFHQAYTIRGKLKTVEENLIPFYTADFIRDGKFRVLDYVKDHFTGKGQLTVFNPKKCDRLDIKQPVHFMRTGVDQVATCLRNLE